MQIDRDKANAELARFTGCNHAETPDFLCGLLPDGSCDEAQVNGDLLWRVMRALYGKTCRLTLTKGYYGDERYLASATYFREYDGLKGADARHAHPVAALYLAAKDAGLLEGEGHE